MWLTDKFWNLINCYDLSDMDKLDYIIDCKNTELMKCMKLVHSGPMRCKNVEDEHRERIETLRDELKILELKYTSIIIDELNKFPLYKPCTIPYIANYIGIKKENMVWDILMKGEDGSFSVALLGGTIHRESNHCSIDIISYTKMVARIRVHITDTDVHRYSYIMRLSNWRFVKSSCSDIFYVERF